MKKLFFVLLSLLLIDQTIYPQFTNQPLAHQSPEVSSLIKEVQAPVSLSSGTININIPLYTLKHGDIEIPISMDYDASGIKIDANPSWVGQNWNLKAGGTVSRIVKGIPDETRIQDERWYVSEGLLYKDDTRTQTTGYLYNYHRLKDLNWNDESQVKSQINTWAIDQQCYELEPDEFVFNFCGHSGKFYINEDRKVVCTDRRYIVDIAIQDIPLYYGTTLDVNNEYTYTYFRTDIKTVGNKDFPGFSRVKVAKIVGFCITAPDGIKYYFGAYHKFEANTLDVYGAYKGELELTADFFSQFFYEEISAWHLERIVSPKDGTVNFEYTRGYPCVSFSRNHIENNIESKAYGYGLFSNISIASAGYGNTDDYYDGKFILPVFLSKISTPNQEVSFKRSNSTTLQYDFYPILDYLKNFYNPKNYDDNLYLENPLYIPRAPICLYAYYDRYGNFYQYLDLSILKTSKLDEISIGSLKKFKFQYNSNSNERLQLSSITEESNGITEPYASFSYNAIQLPGYLSTMDDHWGYFNSMPSLDYGSSYYYSREPVANYTRAGILEKITYPTGGYKEIIYEPNKYNRVVKRDVNSGNLSISSPSTEKFGGGLRVEAIVENNRITSDSIKYTYDHGILNGEIQYYWNEYKGHLLNGTQYKAQRFFSSSLLPVSNNSDGGSVSYTKVTESRTGNGKTEYIFSNHNNTLDGNGISINLQKSPYSPLSSKVVERGKLLQKTIFKEGSQTPLEREIYDYSVPDGGTIFISAVNLQRLLLFNSKFFSAVEGSAYKIYMYPYNVTKKTEYINDGRTNSLIYSNDHQMTYDNYNQISSVLSNDNGINTKKEYKYPYNYTSSVYSRMEAKNMLTPVIEKITSIKNAVETERIKTNYSEFNNGKFFAPSSIQTSYSGVNNLQTINSFDMYDSKGNVVQFTGKDGIKTVYLWGYGGMYPVAEITNADYNMVKIAMGGENVIQDICNKHQPSASDWNKIRSLQTGLPEAFVTSYTYVPFVGVEFIVAPNSSAVRYIYDDFGRLRNTLVGIINSDGTDFMERLSNYYYHYKNQ